MTPIRRRNALMAGVLVAVWVTTSEMDYHDQLGQQERAYERCVISMGAITDMEIVTSMIACSERTGYAINEEEMP